MTAQQPNLVQAIANLLKAVIYRTVKIRAKGHTLTAADPLPDDLHNALTEINAPGGAH